MNSKKRIVPIVVVIFALIGFLGYKNIFTANFEYAGTIEATRIDLPSRVATVVKKLLVDEGSSVKQGQLLAELACEDLALSKKFAEENYKRALNLKNSGSLSREAFDQAQNKMQETETKMSWCEIKSPVDGQILTRFLEPSEWVNPGSKVLSVANMNQLWTYFYVPQEMMSSLKVGAAVVGKVPELNRIFNGSIVKINDEAEFTPKNVQTQKERTRLVFGVKVSFTNQDLILKPGMTILSTLIVK